MSARPGNATGIPTTSNINFTAGGVVVPNSVTVEVPTSGAQAGQIQLWFQGGPGATTDVLVDIVGYYQPGAAGPAGPPGETGARGVSAWDTIPSGQTVTGYIQWDLSAANGFSDILSVAFPARAPSGLTDDMVNFAGTSTVTTDDDAACTGTSTEPTAPAGKACLYQFGSANVGQMTALALDRLPDTGFRVAWTPSAVGADTIVRFTWAYTAP